MKKKRKKKLDIYEQQKQRYWEAYDRARFIKDKFPMLASLSIDMAFEEPDWGGNPSPRQESFGPESKAFFEVECPYIECISGGFNLSNAVSKLVNNRLNETSGTIICQGWQDQERVGQHRCLLKMKYKITATYVKHA
jgi:hypothetical protein